MKTYHDHFITNGALFILVHLSDKYHLCVCACACVRATPVGTNNMQHKTRQIKKAFCILWLASLQFNKMLACN